MTFTPFEQRTPAPPPTPSVLVIQPRVPDLQLVLAAVARLALDVVVADTFEDAKAALRTMHPALLVTDIRLHDYNGLHLLLRARATWPRMAAVVTSTVDDPVLERETHQLSATFVVLPTTEDEMAAAMARTVARGSAPGAPLRGPFERRQHHRRHGPEPHPGPERRQHERRRGIRGALEPAAGSV